MCLHSGTAPNPVTNLPRQAAADARYPSARMPGAGSARDRRPDAVTSLRIAGLIALVLVSGCNPPPPPNAPVDVSPPAAIVSLAVSAAAASSITLTWTAPGDDANSGTARSYDLRYSEAPIDRDNFAAATQVAGEPAPAAAGMSQAMTVTGLVAQTTYYFALKTTDDASNVSGLSNVAQGATTDVSPPGDLQMSATIDGVPWSAAIFPLSNKILPVTIEVGGTGNTSLMVLTGIRWPNTSKVENTQILIELAGMPRVASFVLGPETAAPSAGDAGWAWRLVEESTGDGFEWKTDATHTGTLEIVSVDAGAQVASGTFSFKAHNAQLGSDVDVAAGTFRAPIVVLPVGPNRALPAARAGLASRTAPTGWNARR